MRRVKGNRRADRASRCRRCPVDFTIKRKGTTLPAARFSVRSLDRPRLASREVTPRMTRSMESRVRPHQSFASAARAGRYVLQLPLDGVIGWSPDEGNCRISARHASLAKPVSFHGPAMSVRAIGVEDVVRRLRRAMNMAFEHGGSAAERSTHIGPWSCTTIGCSGARMENFEDDEPQGSPVNNAWWAAVHGWRRWRSKTLF